MKKHLWGMLYGLFLTAFSVYVLLDTFVIERVYTRVPPDNGNGNASDMGNGAADQDSGAPTGQSASLPVQTATSYTDGKISVTITEYRENGTTIYAADVHLSSPAYLKTALASGAYGRNVTENGYVLRNGVLYRSTASDNQEDLVIYADGSFEIITETDISAEQLLADGAQQILCFGPALVIGGELSVTEEEEVGKAKTSNPRTAIGIIDALHYVFVVSDGRTSESEGLSLYELAAFMQSLGADIAYNLDGGGSSTMYFNGEVVNNPTTNGRSIKERSVSDIVYIGY